MAHIHTKGNVNVDEIKIGDIHYEYDYGCGMKVKVLTLPIKNGEQWSWTAEQVSTGKVIDYMVTEGFTHYSINLYDYEAYKVNTML